MTAAEILALARVYLQDEVSPYGWSDSFLLGALNRAQQEVAIRTLCLEDASTAAVCSIAVPALDATVSLDARVLRIEELRYTGASAEKPLLQRTADEFARVHGAAWRTHQGDPQEWSCDGRGLLLYPIPLVNGTISLTVKRLPLLPLALTLGSPAPNPAVASLTPEVPEVLHRPLVHWLCHEAYLVPDTDLYRPDAAAMQLQLFEQTFGPAVSARVRLHQLQNPKSLTLTGRPYISRRGSVNEDW